MRDNLQYTVEVQRMMCVKYDGDAPKETRIRRWLNMLGVPIALAPFKMPAEIIIIEAGCPVKQIRPIDEALSAEQVKALLRG